MHPEKFRLIADPQIHDEIRAHAISEYPHEACGMIIPAGYVRLKNLHREPKRFFECSEQLMPYQLSGELISVVHSHPDGPESPSARDQEQQRAFGIPWGLVMCTDHACSTPMFWGDMLNPPPLEGRPFRHGPSGTDGKGDCGAIVRDWYRINRGIMIPDFARDDRWWLADQHLYLANYERAGFVRADPAKPEVGDVALLQIGPKVTTCNHAAVYLGNQLILHHLERRLSRVEPFVGWNRLMRVWLRYAAS